MGPAGVRDVRLFACVHPEICVRAYIPFFFFFSWGDLDSCDAGHVIGGRKHIICWGPVEIQSFFRLWLRIECICMTIETFMMFYYRRTNSYLFLLRLCWEEAVGWISPSFDTRSGTPWPEETVSRWAPSFFISTSHFCPSLSLYLYFPPSFPI